MSDYRSVRLLGTQLALDALCLESRQQHKYMVFQKVLVLELFEIASTLNFLFSVYVHCFLCLAAWKQLNRISNAMLYIRLIKYKAQKKIVLKYQGVKQPKNIQTDLISYFLFSWGVILSSFLKCNELSSFFQSYGCTLTLVGFQAYCICRERKVTDYKDVIWCLRLVNLLFFFMEDKDLTRLFIYLFGHSDLFTANCFSFPIRKNEMADTQLQCRQVHAVLHSTGNPSIKSTSDLPNTTNKANYTY